MEDWRWKMCRTNRPQAMQRANPPKEQRIRIARRNGKFTGRPSPRCISMRDERSRRFEIISRGSMGSRLGELNFSMLGTLDYELQIWSKVSGSWPAVSSWDRWIPTQHMSSRLSSQHNHNVAAVRMLQDQMLEANPDMHHLSSVFEVQDGISSLRPPASVEPTTSQGHNASDICYTGVPSTICFWSENLIR
jgi:hypothetical protein